MSLPVPKHRYTVSEYIRYEAEANERHEYRNGEIIAMAGGTYYHSLILANVIRELGNALKGKPCRVLESNLRVRSPRVPLYTYPDASIVCGEPQFDQNDSTGQTITNPRVLVEVLSPSTEAYDRGTKFNAYRHLDSLEEYLLVSQDVARVEIYHRQAEGSWLLNSVDDVQARVRLRSLGLELAMSEIYSGVAFPAQE